MRLFCQFPIAIWLIGAGLFSTNPMQAQVGDRLDAPQLVSIAADAPGEGTGGTGQILPAGTNLQVKITREYRMKVHEAIEGRLLFPVFVEGKLAIPSNSLVKGNIVALLPDKAARWHARLRGDFTPFHQAEVKFNSLVLDSGPIPISVGSTVTGAPVLHLGAPGVTTHHSVFRRAWTQAKTRALDQVAYFTAPGLGNRALQLLYHQLPYHPERIGSDTVWSFDLAAPLVLPTTAAPAPPPDLPASVQPGKQEIWSVEALLNSGVTSATAKEGDPVEAVVVAPVLDGDRKLVIPQNSVLVGRVTAATAARSLGRNGKLRFIFQQVRFPSGKNQQVEGALAGATADSAQSLSLDAEGTVSPRRQSSAIPALVLTVLAGRALDEDGNLTAATGVASNGFGLVGRIVGIAAGNRKLAAGIGYYAAALSFYENFLRPGRNVVFPRNTRIEIQTTPLRAPVILPASGPPLDPKVM